MKIKYLLAACICIVLLPACEKYLDAKPDQRLATPSRLRDLQAILDYSPILVVSTYADEASADNYYLTTADYNALSDNGQQRMYTWQPGELFNGSGSEWGAAYRRVYYANTVLDALPTLPASEKMNSERNNVEGQALFVRSLQFFNILNIWAPAYDAATAATDLGIPLRLVADFNERSVRASVQESYDRVLADLKRAASLLPVVPLSPVRASRPAAYGYLARVYLAMRNYPLAKRYADSCLLHFNTLINYNTVDSNQAFPFKPINAESIFYTVSGASIINPNLARIDSTLYQSYGAGDLRRGLFFKKNAAGFVQFKGTYSASTSMFSGLAVDEVYLTRAECQARAGDKVAAMNDLNTLLVTRYKTSSFMPRTAVDAADALQQILTERRKQLVMRFVRWMDIKRLNKEGANIILKRFVNGQWYTLEPNSKLYALAIPEDVMLLSGIPQNPR